MHQRRLGLKPARTIYAFFEGLPFLFLFFLRFFPVLFGVSNLVKLSWPTTLLKSDLDLSSTTVRVSYSSRLSTGSRATLALITLFACSALNLCQFIQSPS